MTVVSPDNKTPVVRKVKKLNCGEIRLTTLYTATHVTQVKMPRRCCQGEAGTHLVDVMHGGHYLAKDAAHVWLLQHAPGVEVIIQFPTESAIHDEDDAVLLLEHCEKNKTCSMSTNHVIYRWPRLHIDNRTKVHRQDIHTHRWNTIEITKDTKTGDLGYLEMRDPGYV